MSMEGHIQSCGDSRRICDPSPSEIIEDPVGMGGMDKGQGSIWLCLKKASGQPVSLEAQCVFYRRAVGSVSSIDTQ